MHAPVMFVLRYEGYEADDPYIESFWQILFHFDIFQKQKFLKFVTGKQWEEEEEQESASSDVGVTRQATCCIETERQRERERDLHS